MVTDHTGLLLAGNNEVMRLLGRGCFAVRSGMGMNLARHAEIRQSQLNNLWGWALVAGVVYAHRVPVVYREYSVCLCVTRQSCGGSASRLVLHPRRLDCWSHGYPCQPAALAWLGGHAFTASWLLSRTACTGTALGYGVLWALMVLLMNMRERE